MLTRPTITNAIVPAMEKESFMDCTCGTGIGSSKLASLERRAVRCLVKRPPQCTYVSLSIEMTGALVLLLAASSNMVIDMHWRCVRDIVNVFGGTLGCLWVVTPTVQYLQIVQNLVCSVHTVVDSQSYSALAYIYWL
jgi:hypothetical protein